MPGESIQMGTYEVLKPMFLYYDDPNPEKPQLEGTLPIGTIITVTSIINPNPLNAQGEPVGNGLLRGNAEAVLNGSIIKFVLYPGSISGGEIEKQAGGRRKSKYSRRSRRSRRNRRKSRRSRR